MSSSDLQTPVAVTNATTTTTIDWAEDPSSTADYEEDCYVDFAEKSNTPSLDDDDDDAIVVHETYEEEEEEADYLLSFLMSDYCTSSSSDVNESFALITDDNDDCCMVETEFVSSTAATTTVDQNVRKFLYRLRKSLNNNNTTSSMRREVRVKYQDLSKPYTARITSQQNYYRFLQLAKERTYKLQQYRRVIKNVNID